MRRQRLRARRAIRSRVSRIRRKSFKKRRDKPTIVNVSGRFGNFVLPDVYKVRLKWHYFEQASVNTATSVIAIYGNGLLAPIYQEAGPPYSTPGGLKELAAMYQLYRVYGSAIRCEFITADAGEVNSCIVCPDQNNLIGVSSEDVAEYPYAKMKTTAAASGGPAKTVIKHFMTTKRIWGRKTLGSDDRFYSPTVSTTQLYPVNHWYWNIMVRNILGGAQAADIALNLTVTYYCEFSLPNKFSATIGDPMNRNTNFKAQDDDDLPDIDLCDKGEWNNYYAPGPQGYGPQGGPI